MVLCATQGAKGSVLNACQTAKPLFCRNSEVLKYPDQLCLSQHSRSERWSAVTWAISANIAPSVRTRATKGVARLAALIQTCTIPAYNQWTR